VVTVPFSAVDIEHVLPSSSNHSDDVLRLLRATDDDFIPPLSARSGTFDDGFAGDAGIERYHADTMEESLLVALEGDDVLGFMSFSPRILEARS